MGVSIVALGWVAFWLLVTRLHFVHGDWVGLVATGVMALLPLLALGRTAFPLGSLPVRVTEGVRERTGSGTTARAEE